MRATLILFAALTLAACGFKGNLYLPDGVQSGPAIRTTPVTVTPVAGAVTPPPALTASSL